MGGAYVHGYNGAVREGRVVSSKFGTYMKTESSDRKAKGVPVQVPPHPGGGSFSNRNLNLLAAQQKSSFGRDGGGGHGEQSPTSRTSKTQHYVEKVGEAATDHTYN